MAQTKRKYQVFTNCQRNSLAILLNVLIAIKVTLTQKTKIWGLIN